MFFFLNTPAAVGWLVSRSLHCPYTILQKLYFVFFFYKYTSCCRQLNQPQAGWCLYCPYTIFQKLCFVSFLNTPSARPGYLRALLYSMSIIQRNHPSVSCKTSHRLDGVFTVHTPSSRNYVFQNLTMTMSKSKINLKKILGTFQDFSVKKGCYGDQYFS